MAGQEGEYRPYREGEYRPYREGLARDLCREYAGYTRLSLAEEHGQVAELWH